ncbi:MAG: amino acid transporter [Mesorhizobium sp.]|nr:MAG: amino acid transporter [Mesorhizobium sp.]
MLPTAVDPVKARQSTSMWRPSAWPAVSPRPGTTLSTPAGRPASMASSASLSAENGDCSAGFSTTELPAASAGAHFQVAMSSGKFHGTTAPTTPSGSRRTKARSPRPVGATSS